MVYWFRLFLESTLKVIIEESVLKFGGLSLFPSSLSCILFSTLSFTLPSMLSSAFSLLSSITSLCSLHLLNILLLLRILPSPFLDPLDRCQIQVSFEYFLLWKEPIASCSSNKQTKIAPLISWSWFIVQCLCYIWSW